MMPKQKPGRSRQTYRTPPDLLRAVERDFGVREWAADLAATRRNSVSPHSYFGPGSPWGRDSLEQDWTSVEGDCWCNPPFKNISPWSSKCRSSLERRGRIFLLVPASVGSNWYAEDVHGIAHVVCLRPRVTFVGCKDPYPKDLLLAVFSAIRGGSSTWKWK
jgi:phage N-6-adenine-methyltransferase